MLPAGDRTLQKGPKGTAPRGKGASSPAELVLGGGGCGRWGTGVAWGSWGSPDRVPSCPCASHCPQVRHLVTEPQFQYSSELAEDGAPSQSPSGHSEPQRYQGCPRSLRKQKPTYSLSSGRCAVRQGTPCLQMGSEAHGSCGEELYSL